MSRVRVAIVMGGRSSEHEISMISAQSVIDALDPERYEVVTVEIGRDGSWALGAGDEQRALAAARDRRALSSHVQVPGTETGPVGTLPVPAASASVAEALADVDVVFPVLHGPFGEDGTIQGLLEMAGVPYVGAGVLASAAGMDKEFAKKLLAAEGLPVGDLVVLRRGLATLRPDERDRLGLPVFVKPARAGSSVGITRVIDWADLDAAITTAREHDPKVLVEAAIAGREVECGVLEFPDGSVRASVPAEIRIVGTNARGTVPEFYDFEAKYLDDVCEFDIPAKLDDEVSERLREMAIAAFRALDVQGLARVDFFVGPNGELTVNEVNTMPGFTPISMFPRAWAVTGLDFQTLLTTMVETAIARGTGLR